MIAYLLTFFVLTLSFFLFKHFTQGEKPNNDKTTSNNSDPAGSNSKKNNKKGKKPAQSQQKEETQVEQIEHASIKQLLKIANKNKKERIHHIQINHKAYMGAFMNFSEQITDFDIHDKYIAISSVDKTFKVFDIGSIVKQNQTFYSHKLKYDYPSALSFNLLGDLLAIALQSNRSIEIYRFSPKDKIHFALEAKFEDYLHENEITEIRMFDKFLITIGSDKDTFIKVWSTSGKEQKHINTNNVQHYCSYISTKFVMIGGWVPDVKIEEILLKKGENEFQSLNKVMQIPHKTHKLFVSEQDERAITINYTDNVMKVWNIDIKFHMKEDTHLLHTFGTEELNKLFQTEDIHVKAAACIRENITQKWLYAFASEKDIVVLDNDMKVVELIKDIAAQNSSICQLQFQSVAKVDKSYILLHVCNKEEARISVFNLSDYINY